MGFYLEADWLPIVTGRVKPLDQLTNMAEANQYGLAAHAAVRELAKKYPHGAWEPVAAAYYHALEYGERLVAAGQDVDQFSTMVAQLKIADMIAKLEVQRVGADKDAAGSGSGGSTKSPPVLTTTTPTLPTLPSSSGGGRKAVGVLLIIGAIAGIAGGGKRRSR